MLVEYSRADLQKPVRPDRSPSHVLFLDESFTYDLVDGRLDEASGNRLAVPTGTRLVWDRRKVRSHVTHEFLKLVLYGFCPLRFSTNLPG